MDMWYFARICAQGEVGVSSRNVVSRTFPQFSQSMLTPMAFSSLESYVADSEIRSENPYIN